MSHQSFTLKTDLFDEFVASKNRIVLIEAPCGYGKTTLLTYMHRQKKDSKEISIWLTLKPKNNIPKYFKRSFLRAAYKNKELLEFFEAHHLDKYEIEHDRIIDHIEDYTRIKKNKINLYLDNFEHIDDSDIIEFIEEISENHNISISIASRCNIPANLGIEANISRFPRHDFLFNHSETQLFISNLLGWTLRPGVCQLLYKKTEGWPKTLEILTKSFMDIPILSEPNVMTNDNFLDVYSGKNHELELYFTQNMFDGLSKHLVDFLLRSSLFLGFDDTLCKALTGDHYQTIISELKACNFITYSDLNGRFAFSYPTLVKEYLFETINNDPSFAHDKIMISVANWYVANNYPVKATRCFITAKAYEAGSKLLSLSKVLVMAEGNIVEIRDWFAKLPLEYILSDINLLFLQSWYLLHACDWRTVEKNKKMIKDLVKHKPSLISDAKGYQEELLFLEIGISYLKNSPQENIHYFEQRKDEIASLSGPLRGSITNTRALVYFAFGDYEKMYNLSAQAMVFNKEDARQYPLASSRLFNILATLGQGFSSEASGEGMIFRTDCLADSKHDLHTIGVLLEGIITYEIGEINSSYLWLVESLTTLKDCVSHHVQALAVRRYVAILTLKGIPATAIYTLNDYNANRAEKIGQHIKNQNEIELLRIFLIGNDIKNANKTSLTIDFDYRLYGIQAQICDARLSLENSNPKQAITKLLFPLIVEYSFWERAEKSLLLAYAYHANNEKEKAKDQLSKLLLSLHDTATMLFVELGQKSFELFDEYLESIYQTLARDQKIKIEKLVLGSKKMFTNLTGEDVETNVSGKGYSLIEPLSGKEQEILDLMVEGHTNKHIADVLSISINTVKWHVRHILEKFCVEKRTQVIAIVNKNL